MMIEVSAYRWVPPFAQGYVKDLRVRWALEEAGLAYQVSLIDLQTKNSADYRRWQPFCQVPAYRDETVELFESGAILIHLAAQSDALAPRDEAGRARVSAWVIAALNSVEPHAQNVIRLGDAEAGDAEVGGAWARDYRAGLEALLNARLDGLSAWLEGKVYLEGRFTAADIVMATVLRELVDCGALASHPVVSAYLERCVARPAFSRALEAQLAVFRDHEPA